MSVEQPASSAVVPPPERVVTLSAARNYGDWREITGMFRGGGIACAAVYISSLFGYGTLPGFGRMPPGFWLVVLGLLLLGTAWFLGRYTASGLNRPSV
jgi:hypothetical protein